MIKTLKCKIKIGDNILNYVEGDYLKGNFEIKKGQKKGNAFLSFDFKCNDDTIEDEVLLEELDFIIIPVGITKQSDIENEEPLEIINPNIPMGNIFTELEQNNSKAIVNNPDKSSQSSNYDSVPDTIKNVYGNENPKKEKEVVVSVVNKKDYIRDVNELIDQIEKCKNKTSNIDPSKIENERKRFEAIERKNIEESLDKNLWITIDSNRASSLIIGDLDELILNEGEALNLSTKSAKTLAKSNDLISLIKNGYIKIISPQEASSITKKDSWKEDSIIVERNSVGATNTRYDFSSDQQGFNSSHQDIDLATDIDIGAEFETEGQRLINMTGLSDYNDNSTSSFPDTRHVISPQIQQHSTGENRLIRPAW